MVARVCVIVSLVLLVLATISHAVIADDGWIHIATGRMVLAQGAVPARDLFSFTHAGAAWVNWEWLSGVVLAVAWDGLGVPGLFLLRGVLFGGALVCLWLEARPWVKPAQHLPTVVMLVAAAMGLHYRVGDRPHCLGFFLFALVTLLMRRFVKAPGWKRASLILLLLLAWSQAHPSWYLGIGFGAAMLVDGMLDRPQDRRRLSAWMGLGILGSAGVALSVPGGAAYYGRALSMLEGGASSEWSGLYEHYNHGHPWFAGFHLSLGLWLLAFWRDRARRLRLEHLAVAVLAALCVRHARFVPFLCMATVPQVARGLAFVTPAWGQTREGLARLVAVRTWPAPALTLVAACWVLVESLRLYPGALWSLDADGNPVTQVAFMRTHGLSGTVFAPSRGANGYLSMALWPEVRTAFDGRTPQLFAPDHMETLENIASDDAFAGVADRYRFDWVVLPGPLFSDASRRWGWILRSHPDYELVYFDLHGQLWGRRGGERGTCDDACVAYQALEPWRMGGSWAASVATEHDLAAVSRELVRLSSQPHGRPVAAAAAASLLAQGALPRELVARLSPLAE